MCVFEYINKVHAYPNRPLWSSDGRYAYALCARSGLLLVCALDETDETLAAPKLIQSVRIGAPSGIDRIRAPSGIDGGASSMNGLEGGIEAGLAGGVEGGVEGGDDDEGGGGKGGGGNGGGGNGGGEEGGGGEGGANGCGGGKGGDSGAGAVRDASVGAERGSEGGLVATADGKFVYAASGGRLFTLLVRAAVKQYSCP